MKFVDTLRSLSPQRQAMLAAAVLAVVFAMFFLARSVVKEPMALLYAGLDPAVTGEIIQELEQSGIAYEIRGESIFIPQSARDRTRFSLAQQGLPRQSVQGYELLDGINGFSVTSEMYNAAYWRAKEGELTRTILSTHGITSARVHIGASLRSGFSRTQAPQTASVTLTTAHDLTPDQAEAIQYLVALAVSGLNAEDVAVIDPTKGILAGPNVDKAMQPAIVAEDQASAVEQRIMRLLEARVGAGNARVSVSVDVSREMQRISEVRFDPASRILRSRTTSESSETNTGGGGALTVASNLPAGDAQGGGSASEAENASESVAYEFNEVRMETEKLPGEIERVSVGVLLNQDVLGLDLAAPGLEAQLAEIAADFEQLIIAGAGLDLERGDSLTVDLMPFQTQPVEDLVAAPGLMERLVERYLWSGIQALMLSLVIVALAFGVIRPMLTRQPSEAEGSLQAAMAGAEGFEDGPDPAADPIAYLQDYTSDKQEDAAALLQDWLNEDRKAAGNG